MMREKKTLARVDYFAHATRKVRRAKDAYDEALYEAKMGRNKQPEKYLKDREERLVKAKENQRDVHALMCERIDHIGGAEYRDVIRRFLLGPDKPDRIAEVLGLDEKEVEESIIYAATILDIYLDDDAGGKTYRQRLDELIK